MGTEASTARRFYTDAGVEVPAVTEDQMREVDRIATEETGPNLFQMMENAGRSLAELAMQLMGEELHRSEIVVLAGTEGNGGGGVCAARHLANHGAQVKLCLSNPDQLRDVPAYQRVIFRTAGGREVHKGSLQGLSPKLIIDALIGYTLRSAPRGAVAELIRWANKTRAPILALDVPSGVDATTGHTPGEFIRPQWTLTLALPKTGLFPELTGELFLADIGIPGGTYHRLGLDYTSPFGNRFYVPLRHD